MRARQMILVLGFSCLVACSREPEPTPQALTKDMGDSVDATMQPEDMTPASDLSMTPEDQGNDLGEPEDMGPQEVDHGLVYPDNWKTIAAANAYPTDHPLAEGQHRFLYDTWGVEKLDKYPSPEFMLALMEDEPEVFGNQFENFGFIPDPEDDFPIGLKRGIEDPTRMAETCGLCHVGKLEDGSLWFGLPNQDLDIERFREEVDKRWVAAGNPPRGTELSSERAERVGPGRVRAESDEFPAFVPVDIPTYFNLDQRAHFGYLGAGRELRSEIYVSIFNTGAGKPNERTAIVPFPETDRVAAFIDFMGALRAPVNLSPPDATLVERGAEVFAEAQCNACHHPQDPGLDAIIETVQEGEPEYLPGENEAFPTGAIATSYAHRLLIEGVEGAGSTDSGRANLVAFIIKNGLVFGQSDGYRATDLAGLWATAPYLHNGSVPTLEALLLPPEERPSTWMKGSFTFDTSAAGNTNAGHAFGTALSDEDREALIAYLMTL